MILGKDSLSCDQNDQIDLIVEINLSPKTEESNWSSQNLLVIPCVHSVHFTVIKNYQAKTIKSLPIVDTPISDKLIYSCERHQTSQKKFYRYLVGPRKSWNAVVRIPRLRRAVCQFLGCAVGLRNLPEIVVASYLPMVCLNHRT